VGIQSLDFCQLVCSTIVSNKHHTQEFPVVLAWCLTKKVSSILNPDIVTRLFWRIIPYPFVSETSRSNLHDAKHTYAARGGGNILAMFLSQAVANDR
jgi:hypothetical protein